jgi:hypothetical protein
MSACLVPFAIYFATALAGGPVGRPPADVPSGLHADARTAVAPDPAAAQAACDRLRAEGPAGLDALIAEHQAVLAKGTTDPMWPRVTQAMDRVAAQKDAYASRLFWYTDLEQAKAAARSSGKPILSLHLAGRLDRTQGRLYADPKVSALLRERFVLHWESAEPAPKVTLDLGAGKSIERPTNGNNVHYVLDADGRPVDALPDVARANVFQAELAEDAELERSLRGLTPEARAARLTQYHLLRKAVLEEKFPAFMVDATKIRGDHAWFAEKAAKPLTLAAN